MSQYMLRVNVHEGWVDIGTGMKVLVVLLDIDYEFVIRYFFEDLQKNAATMCGDSIISECRLCCVSCLA
jgi:hypothetical protein